MAKTKKTNSIEKEKAVKFVAVLLIGVLFGVVGMLLLRPSHAARLLGTCSGVNGIQNKTDYSFQGTGYSKNAGYVLQITNPSNNSWYMPTFADASGHWAVYELGTTEGTYKGELYSRTNQGALGKYLMSCGTLTVTPQ